MPFLPKDFAVPSTSNYMKLVEGKNKFRVLSDAITGWEYWTVDKKPISSRTEFEEMPNNNGKPPKFFIAFVVWNYQDERVQILEITQKTIITALQVMNEDSDWGEPSKYDITVNRTGTTMENTEYTVTPKDAELAQAIGEAYKKTSINLEALYDGKDPFSTEVQPNTDKNTPAFSGKNYPKNENETINPLDVPF